MIGYFSMVLADQDLTKKAVRRTDRFLERINNGLHSRRCRQVGANVDNEAFKQRQNPVRCCRKRTGAINFSSGATRKGRTNLGMDAIRE